MQTEGRYFIKRNRIGRKTMIIMTCFVLMLSLAICLAAGYYYYSTSMARYRDEAFGYSGTLAKMISGDRISTYIETGEKDRYYEAIREYMDSARNECDMLYYYVIVPLDNKIMYIWDADNENSIAYLGETEEYVEGDKEAIQQVMCEDPPQKLKVTRDKVYGAVASAYSPVYDNSGKAVAVAACDLELSDMVSGIVKFILNMALGIILISGIFGLMLYKLLTGKLVNPILNLSDAASSMVDNLNSDETLKLDIHTGDEVEDLASSFNKMYSDLKEYIAQLSEVTAEKERISTELSLARRIQADMLPSEFPPFPERRDFDIFASMKPAKEVGGDFYDFFLIDDDHLGFCIADVSGKGIPAALFMMMSMIMIRNYTLSGRTPAEVLEIVNRQICGNNREEMFVTVWLGILDLASGRLTAANAGHEYPVVRKPDGEFELFRDKHGFVIGGMEELEYKEYEIQMEPGSGLFLFTDGVAEAADINDERFGQDRMLSALNSVSGGTPEEILNEVSNALTVFTGAAPQFDDITMLCVEYNGSRYQGEGR